MSAAGVAAAGRRAGLAEITLRPGHPSDAAALFAIWDAAVRATHPFLAPADRAFYAALVRDHYLPAAELIVAASGRTPVGFLGLNGDRIEALYVRTDWFRRGVGRRLVAEAVARVGVPRLEVNEPNHAARAFYARLGFREVGRSVTDAAGLPYPLIHLALR